jgi:PhzF family phenazine biosynthesis protein
MRYYVVDAFTDELFKGNPAGVCLVDEFPDDDVMQNVAAENNLAETAFAYAVNRNNRYDLRWFTPETEIDLCGHATLATAFVITNFVNKELTDISFNTKSGILNVTKTHDLFVMDFPARIPVQVEVTGLMEDAAGVKVLEAHLARDMLLLLENEETVRKLNPDMRKIAAIPGCFGLIVTAKGSSKDTDFVSRFFAPGAGIPEDPVTGSSHTSLIPFWAKRLNKEIMTAKQLSKRGGTLYCENCGDRVKIAGRAALYLTGEIIIP